ncbi:hypothetical protein VPNG_09511 [Cytospora leucostoma]|uniref:Uncharacterized protein n=1 Tax=Cytospora leucostoma TaxID=1230097 RepID=A0A423VS57_9PEZI|nr:hypothetical protein VPNG_09511 [Cytospora leucostoma]
MIEFLHAYTGDYSINSDVGLLGGKGLGVKELKCKIGIDREIRERANVMLSKSGQRETGEQIVLGLADTKHGLKTDELHIHMHVNTIGCSYKIQALCDLARSEFTSYSEASWSEVEILGVLAVAETCDMTFDVEFQKLLGIIAGEHMGTSLVLRIWKILNWKDFYQKSGRLRAEEEVCDVRSRVLKALI